MSDDQKPRNAPQGSKNINDQMPVFTTVSNRGNSNRDDDYNNDLDRVLDEQVRDDIKDLKRLKIKRYIVEERSKLDQLQENGKSDVEGDNDTVSLDDAKMIAELPEEKRQEILKYYMMLKSAGKTKGDSGLMLPLMLGLGAQGKPTSDIKDFADSFTTALTMGMQIAAPKEGGSDIRDTILTKLLDDRLKEKEGDGKEDFFAVLTKAKEMGLVVTPQQMQEMVAAGGAGNKASADLNKEIELARIKSTERIELAKVGADLTKTDRFENLINKGMRAAASALGEKQADEDGAPPEGQKVTVATAQCPQCKSPISVPEPEKARQINCPSCKATLDWKPD
jgi:hypothetical protein